MDKCKHNQGFIFHRLTNEELPGIWCCNQNCGFYLNFNPEDFEKGIAYVVNFGLEKTPENEP